MQKQLFGTLPTGKEIFTYTLTNKDASVSIMTFGATITNFTVFGTSVVASFDNLEDYLADTAHHGALIGRVANRISNAQLSMDGKTYQLPRNDGKHCLHGGNGFDRHVFTVTDVTENGITLCYTSPDGEEGFPATLQVCVTYTLIGASLRIDYTATPDNKTPIILTNHAYFNLDGFGDTVLDHTVQIFASAYTEVDDALIPTGKRIPVAGTPYDLNTPTRLGDKMPSTLDGYDNYFHVAPTSFASFNGKTLGLVATAQNKKLQLNTYTDQPGLQLYTGNFLGGERSFKGNAAQVKHGAFCLETQTEPDCVSHGKEWYNAGETYTHTTVYEVIKL